MESKIPLPTDNVYKFYALFSLLLLIFSLGAFLYVQQSANEQVIEILPELEVLKEVTEPSTKDAVRKQILERQLEVIASDRKFFNRSLGVIIGIAISGICFGFLRWHWVIQPLQDEQAKIQLEISRLQLEKLKAESAKAVRADMGETCQRCGEDPVGKP
ncbi:hypothetical protein [Stutzerimonas kunmingensis]|uniref:hypothetical protein n=1 Tax=Stutzerimonas kunmingensis TaxID=1211807 RepID=UPI0021052599|nr:hypothetical protein [Stutzerimonas kunmingensis]MCQ2036578.1 hypothetical protein [Stutzerimonas kunmingensis]